MNHNVFITHHKMKSLFLLLFLRVNFCRLVSAALFNRSPVFKLLQSSSKPCINPMRTKGLCSTAYCPTDSNQSPRLLRYNGHVPSQHIETTLSLSGGDGNLERNDQSKKIIMSSLLLVLSVVGFVNRSFITEFNFKEFLSMKLDLLASSGNRGLICYTLGFALWEILVGVTTPVETAAGMAFGLQRALIANAFGKTLGAICAFLLGRFILYDYVTKKLDGNEYLDLVKDSIVKNPIRVALIWRFSFLPEQMKNFGLAVLPLKTWQFVTAVIVHGFPFSCLWTFLGNEMGLVVRYVHKIKTHQ